MRAESRQIKDGSKYDALFPVSSGRKKWLGRGEPTLTQKLMVDWALMHLHEGAGIAKELKRNSVYDTCKAVFDFCVDYLHYDIEDGELLRSPARTWSDSQIKARSYQASGGVIPRVYSADCDDMSIFIASILLNLGIHPIFRMTSYKSDKTYQHVYVAVEDNGKTIKIDPVWGYFNSEKPYTVKKDLSMSKIDIYGLSGVGNLPTEPVVNDPVVSVTTEPVVVKDINFFSSVLAILFEKDFLTAYSLVSEYRTMIQNNTDGDSMIWKSLADKVLTATNFDELALYLSDASIREYEIFDLKEVNVDKGLFQTDEEKAASFTLEKMLDMGTKLGHYVMMINPTFIFMRNLFRWFMSINLFGIGSMLGLTKHFSSYEQAKSSAGISLSTWDKSSSLLSKMANFFYLIGGSKDKFYQSAREGASIAPLFRKFSEFPSQSLNDLVSQDLSGGVVTSGAILATTPIFMQYLTIILSIGLTLKDLFPNIGTSTGSGTGTGTDTWTATGTNNAGSQSTDISLWDTIVANATKNALPIALSAAGLIYMATKGKDPKPKKLSENGNKKKLQGISKVRLS